MRRWSVFLVLVSCVRTSPQPPPEPPPVIPTVRVPEGCLEDLSGAWRHADDPAFTYLAADDGGSLSLQLTHRAAPDAGFVPRKFRRDAGADAVDAGNEPLDAGSSEDAGSPAATIELLRSADGFAGATRALLRHPGGRLCEARFPTRVVSCADGGLLLETSASVSLGDGCQAPAVPAEQPPERHLLIRPAADGGR
ncbi:MAG: hypothetical protein ACOZQL_23675 [Myxococcota bacterium]